MAIDICTLVHWIIDLMNWWIFWLWDIKITQWEHDGAWLKYWNYRIVYKYKCTKLNNTHTHTISRVEENISNTWGSLRVYHIRHYQRISFGETLDHLVTLRRKFKEHFQNQPFLTLWTSIIQYNIYIYILYIIKRDACESYLRYVYIYNYIYYIYIYDLCDT